MKRYTFVILCIIFSALFFSNIENSQEVLANSCDILDSFTLEFENKTWNYIKKPYENFYIDKLRQQREYEVKNNGFRETIVKLKTQGISDLDIIEYIYPNFKTFFANIQNEIEKEYKEPEIHFHPNNENMWKIDDESVGKKIDVKDLLLNLSLGNKFIELKVDTLTPKYTKNELLENTHLRSSQSTSFVGSENGRRYNIIKALDCFNGLIIQPDEQVSFQYILDKNDNGLPYQKATVIVNGEFVKGIGGGVCQASTTLYNAVLMAGLEILEVHNHTLPVGYVERGFDAMVNDSGLDLRFRNNTSYPIYIKTFAKNERAYAQVYGTSLNGISFKKHSVQVERLNPPSPKVIPDKEGKYKNYITYKGEYHTTRYAQYGYKVDAYLQTFKDGVMIENKLIRKETYAPTQSIIYEGVKDKSDIETINENKSNEKEEKKNSQT